MARLCDLSYLMLFVGVLSVNIGLSQFRISMSQEDQLTVPIITPDVFVLPQEVYAKVGDTFVINVTVGNASDMYAWQVHLNFNSSIVELVNVSLPPEYVFSYAYTLGGALVDHNRTEFKNPIQRIRNDRGWLLTGDTLIGQNQTTFNGSGILCQIEFKAVSSGSSALGLSTNPTDFGTYIINSDLQVITPSAFNSMVLVEHSNH